MYMQVAQSDFQTGFWETSALTGDNIRDCFEHLAHAITDINNPQLVCINYDLNPTPSSPGALTRLWLGGGGLRLPK